MSIYPDQVSKMAQSSEFSGRCCDENALGKSVSFVCGSFVTFSFRINSDAKLIEGIRYTTNGCGFAVAASEALAKELHGTGLTELHGTNQIEKLIRLKLGDLPPFRAHCSEIAIEALRAALANYRERLIEEFQGEKALICTCFGVAEETIISLIEKHRISEPSELAQYSNAGSGCGSCQMLIHELIDAPKH